MHKKIANRRLERARSKIGKIQCVRLCHAMVRLHLDSFLVTEAQRASALQEVQEVCTGRMELLKDTRRNPRFRRALKQSHGCACLYLTMVLTDRYMWCN